VNLMQIETAAAEPPDKNEKDEKCQTERCTNNVSDDK